MPAPHVPAAVERQQEVILALRRKYRGLRETAHKQMGTRALQEAGWLLGRNGERVEELLDRARFHLPYAQELDRRERERATP